MSQLVSQRFSQSCDSKFAGWVYIQSRKRGYAMAKGAVNVNDMAVNFFSLHDFDRLSGRKYTNP
jgi:hypothetical protein